MHIPKNYFHDRLVLLLVSINIFLAVFTSLLIIFRLNGSSSEGFIGQYHANLGLSAFEPGNTTTYVAFIAFVFFVAIFHTLLSMRMYYRRHEYAIAVLCMGLFLLLLALIVSNALSVLQ